MSGTFAGSRGLCVACRKAVLWKELEQIKMKNKHINEEDMAAQNEMLKREIVGFKRGLLLSSSSSESEDEGSLYVPSEEEVRLFLVSISFQFKAVSCFLLFFFFFFSDLFD